VRAKLKLCIADMRRVSPETIAAHVDLAKRRATMPWSDATFLAAARSIVRLLARPSRFFSMVDEVRAPTLLLHGGKDRLVAQASAEALARHRPDWAFHLFPDLGHIPQVEDPAAVVSVIEHWLLAQGLLRGGRPAAQRARDLSPSLPPA
jgi:pimeloyl-ACP methyl ester carboxylesterase